jgi:hypothetical protein
VQYNFSSIIAAQNGTSDMISRELVKTGHTVSFVIHRAHTAGWDLTIERDHVIVRHARLGDWHRVERALGRITQEIEDLQTHGWTEVTRAVQA